MEGNMKVNELKVKNIILSALDDLGKGCIESEDVVTCLCIKSAYTRLKTLIDVIEWENVNESN